jgi:hypothetical protein
MQYLTKALMAMALLMLPYTVGYAATQVAKTSGAAVQTKEDDRLPIQKQDEWQFFVSPYLWIPGLNITTSSLRNTRGIDIPWWNTASALFSNTMGVMGRIEAWKGRWGIYLDGYYTYVGTSGSQVGASRDISFGPVDFTLNKQINLGGMSISVPIPGKVGEGNITLTPSGSAKYISRMGNLDLGVRFLVGTWPLKTEKPLPAVSLELIGGPRFNSINQYVRINLSSIRIGNVPIDLGKFTLVGKHQSIKNGSYVIDFTKQYFEPFLGLRLGLWLNQKFVVTIMADTGGFGLVADDHVDCNFEALCGYRVNKHFYVWLGYRALGTWYNLGENLAQIDLSGWAHGPVLGTTYTF